MRALGSLQRLTAAGIAMALALVVVPAKACGCGAYIPGEGEARVAQERALIRWDGRTEDIVMELGVEGRSRDAAWILPLPSRATVQLGDARLFDVLQELTKPQVRVEHMAADATTAAGGGAGAAAVTLLERQALGPFDVSTLAATDAQALDRWLSANGYQLPAGLAATLEPYVAQDWVYVAVRLAPKTADQALTGRLDPLWVTFASDRIIYPMRPTALARGELPVFLYVLADHRVETPAAFAEEVYQQPGQAIGWANVPYAQWIEPAAVDQDSPLAPFVQRKLFLTKFDIFLFNPAGISDDFVFPFAARDETYHEVQVQYVVDVDPNAATATGAPEATADPNSFWIVAGLALLWVPLVLVLLFAGARHWRRP